MEKTPWQKIIRVFYEYPTEVLLYVEEGFIRGIIVKQDIEQTMSDMQLMTESREIPVKKLTSLDITLEIHQNFGFEQDGKKVLAVINRNHDFNGLWDRTQIIRSWQGMPQVSKWQPGTAATIPRPEPSAEKPERIVRETAPAGKEPAQKPAADKTVPVLKGAGGKKNQKTEATPETGRPPEETSAQEDQPSMLQSLPALVRKQVENGILAILTLETLPIPLLAVDTTGNELFINQDWERLRGSAGKTAENTALVRQAKNVMAEMAEKGQLTAQSTVPLQMQLGEFNIQLRTIRRDDREKTPRTIGYLFWGEKKSRGEAEKPGYPLRRDYSPDVLRKTSSTASYSGRSLTDIVQEEEKKAILWAMDEAGGNQSNAAMLLGIPRQTFSYKYGKYFKKQ